MSFCCIQKVVRIRDLLLDFMMSLYYRVEKDQEQWKTLKILSKGVSPRLSLRSATQGVWGHFDTCQYG